METTMNKTAKTILNFVKDFVKANAMGVQLTISRECSDLKKTNNPFWDKVNKRMSVTKITRYGNVTIGRRYISSVENRSDNPLPYEVEKPSGRHYQDGCYPYLQTSDKDENQHYLVFYTNKNSVIETTYFVDGREATEEQIALIKALTPKKDYGCKKQSDYGVADEDIVKQFAPKVENVRAIKFGAKSLTL